MNKKLTILVLGIITLFVGVPVVSADIPIEVNPQDMTCWSPQYECFGPDSPKYSASCKAVLKQYEGEYEDRADPPLFIPYEELVCHGPDFPCYTCASGKSYYFPIHPAEGLCPVGRDQGQTDGTGQGLFQTTDFDRPSLGDGSGLANVPPMHILADDSGLQSIPIVDAPLLPDLPADNAPCGWPVNGRAVTGVCPASYSPQYPSDASSVSTTYAHSYPAIDISVQNVSVATTMAGTAYRCAARLDQLAGSNNPGIYVRVVDSVNGYATQYLHLKKEAGDVSPYENPSCDYSTQCAYGGCLVGSWNVGRGDVIGTSSNTGDSRPQGTGYHLHYEVWYTGQRICPATFMDYTAQPCLAPVEASFLDKVLDVLNPF